MARKVCKIGLALAAMIASPAMASDSIMVQILNFNPSVDGSGLLTISTNGTCGARPACAAIGLWTVAVNTPAGQFMASSLLTAYSKASGYFFPLRGE